MTRAKGVLHNDRYTKVIDCGGRIYVTFLFASIVVTRSRSTRLINRLS